MKDTILVVDIRFIFYFPQIGNRYPPLCKFTPQIRTINDYPENALTIC